MEPPKDGGTTVTSPSFGNGLDPDTRNWLLATKHLRLLAEEKHADFWSLLVEAYDRYPWLYFEEQIKKICDRRFGIGADGLMLIEKHPTLDFNLVYYNSDGSQSLCGNGSRAAVMMASFLGMINGQAQFNAYDGPHDAELLNTGAETDQFTAKIPAEY